MLRGIGFVTVISTAGVVVATCCAVASAQTLREVRACPGLSPIASPPEQLFVAPGGDDTAAGTISSPLASLGEAAKRFPLGGTVTVRGGVYGAQTLAATGTSGHPLLVRAAAGEAPIFDGSAVTKSWAAVIHLTAAKHVVLQGLEVRNGTAPNVTGIGADGPVSDLTIRDCVIHDMSGTLSRFAGDTITFEGNEFYNGSMVNAGFPPQFHSGGWPTCMGSAPDFSNPASPWPTNVTIRGNHIHDCWGEGIGIWFGSHVIVDDNVVERTFSVGIYLDNASNVEVARNFVLMQAPMSASGSAGRGVLIAVEPYSVNGLTYQPAHDITIVNNVLVGNRTVGWWSSPNTSPSNTYANVAVLQNTLISPASVGIGFDKVPQGSVAPTNCRLTNNVISEAKASVVWDAPAFAVAGNAWLNESRPTFAGQSDVSTQAVVGSVTAATDVEPLASQVGAGVASGVLGDILCAPRNPCMPTRGAFER
jgi:hypothetical protein